MKKLVLIFLNIALLILCGCTGNKPQASDAGAETDIFPDYKDVTVPSNIAPLVFKSHQPEVRGALFCYDGKELFLKNSKGVFSVPSRRWKAMLSSSAGKSIQVTLYSREGRAWHSHPSFCIHVSEDPVDSFLVYRRIAPGYRMWNAMGIYQRNLENFEEKAIVENKFTDNSCVNCHSFRMQKADTMFFHQRSAHAGSYFLTKGELQKLDFVNKTGGAVPPLTYPAWHPSGRFIAFSSNDTHQDFHIHHANRIEVFDVKSDIYVYDVQNKELFTSPLLCSDGSMATFPAFSPDGRSLYYCAADTVSMPGQYDRVRYNLLRIGFDPESKSFGNRTDTLYNAGKEGGSAKFPRVSPDGSLLMYTVSAYGNFSIWHHDADLRMIHLEDNSAESMQIVNSEDTESYHSWGHNGRWFVFSSRRLDGLYTRLYLAHVDGNGHCGKPFLLPQKDIGYYDKSLFSFNVPELTTGKVQPAH